jgi:hypothetical protein
LGKKNIIKTGSDFSVHLTSHNQIWRIVLGLLGVLAIYGATTLIFIYGLTYLGFNAALVLQGSN